MAIREGRWDCQYCGTIGNLGRHHQCHNCGRSRPESTKFYLADNEQVTDKQLQRQALVGPDWICQFCGTSNAADITICGSCRAPRESDSPSQQVKDYDLSEVPTSGDMTFDDEPSSEEPIQEEPSTKRKIPIIALVAAGALVVICLTAIAFLIFGGRESEATVDGFLWERTLDIEELQTVVEEDWQIPSGGRLLSQREAIHHYDQILDHYETRQREIEEQVQVGVEVYVCGQRDLGNGFFEDIECEEPVYETRYRTETFGEPIYRDEPVYQTLYSYDIDKWTVISSEVASGNDHSPYWPRANLEENQREGDTDEYYVVYFVDDEGEIHEWETTWQQWQRLEQGQQVVLKFNALGQVDEIARP